MDLQTNVNLPEVGISVLEHLRLRTIAWQKAGYNRTVYQPGYHHAIVALPNKSFNPVFDPIQPILDRSVIAEYGKYDPVSDLGFIRVELGLVRQLAIYAAFIAYYADDIFYFASERKKDLSLILTTINLDDLPVIVQQYDQTGFFLKVRYDRRS